LALQRVPGPITPNTLPSFDPVADNIVPQPANSIFPCSVKGFVEQK